MAAAVLWAVPRGAERRGPGGGAREPCADAYRRQCARRDDAGRSKARCVAAPGWRRTNQGTLPRSARPALARHAAAGLALRTEDVGGETRFHHGCDTDAGPGHW